jgi:glycosyltransferase involved in cell wall biosynthesis
MSGVVHVITALERGGAQRVVLDVAAGLHRPERPQLVVSGPSGALDDEARRRFGARLFTVPALRNAIGAHDVAALLDLTRLLRRLVARLRPPVVVHTHSSKAGVLGRLAARSVDGAVSVHTVHGFGTQALGPRWAPLLALSERIAAGASDELVFVSQRDREIAIADGLCRAEQTRVIRPGVEPKDYITAQRPRAGPARVAVTVANLKPQKDPLFHIDILAAWRRRQPDARLIFLGDGPLRAPMLARARELGVDAALELPGFVEDVRPSLAAADVFVLASAWEGLPRAVLEATAAGVPCVVKDTGWAKDVSFARSITALPTTATADDFADAIVRKHKAAPKKLPKEFTQAGMLAGLQQLYDELCGPVLDDDERLRMLRRRRRLRR